MRERKKRRTRGAISATAWRLFAEQGFDATTVARIARETEISERTLFAYFPTKEDLVFGQVDTFANELVAALDNRPPGMSILTAFGEYVLSPRHWLAQDRQQSNAGLETVTRVITGSEALLSRERQILERNTRALADLIERTTRKASGNTVEAWVIANALMGVHRAMIDHSRRQILTGTEPNKIARDVQTLGKRAITLLSHGLGDLGSRPRDRALRPPFAGPPGTANHATADEWPS